MFQIERTVAISDTAPGGCLRLSHALDYLLECECFQMDSEDDFSVYLRNNGIAVFLAFRQVEIIRLPAYGEHLTIRTNVYDCKNFFGFRNTTIYDAQGNICVLCAAIGAFVDRASGRPGKVPAQIVRDLRFDPPLPMEYLSRKITLPAREPELLAPFRVKEHEADMYGHFNSNRSFDETMEDEIRVIVIATCFDGEGAGQIPKAEKPAEPKPQAPAAPAKPKDDFDDILKIFN